MKVIGKHLSFVILNEGMKVFLRKNCSVAERSVNLRRCVARHAGGIRSANADMSNDKGGEKPPRRKTKVSYPMLIRIG